MPKDKRNPLSHWPILAAFMLSGVWLGFALHHPQQKTDCLFSLSISDITEVDEDAVENHIGDRVTAAKPKLCNLDKDGQKSKVKCLKVPSDYKRLQSATADY